MNIEGKVSEKKLTQKERLEQDVVKFNQQIESTKYQIHKSEQNTVNLGNQLHQLIGAKTYAELKLKQENENAVREEGKDRLQESERVKEEGNE